MAKFKTEEDVLNETKEDKTVRCPVCKSVMSSMPVNIYCKDGSVWTVCHVNKCLRCGEITDFYTFTKEGRPDFNCKNANLPAGISFMTVKMYLWKNNRSTQIIYDDLKGE